MVDALCVNEGNILLRVSSSLLSPHFHVDVFIRSTAVVILDMPFHVANPRSHLFLF